MDGDARIRLFEACRHSLLSLIEAHYGPLSEFRLQFRRAARDAAGAVTDWIDARAEETLSSLLVDYWPDAPPGWRRSPQANAFRRRLVESAIEELSSERLHPALRIDPAPADPPEAKRFHGLIFNQPANAYNELFPLMVDSYIHDLSARGRLRRGVLAVRCSWLNESGEATRAMWHSPEDDALIEAELTRPVAFDSVHYLCIDPSAHQQWGDLFRTQEVIEANPQPVAALLDDKFACYQHWNENGTLTPEAELIPREDARNAGRIREALETLFSKMAPSERAWIVVQPNQGTEGRGVSAFEGPWGADAFLASAQGLAENIHAIAEHDDVLIRHGIESALLIDEALPAPAPFDIRVNVCDGRAESGCFQTGSDSSVIASVSQGGRIVEWKSLERAVVRFADGEETPFAEIKPAIEAAATQATAGFGRCALIGLDLRVGAARQGGTPCIQAIDANPRPAGLAHARYWNGEPGATQMLWTALER